MQSESKCSSRVPTKEFLRRATSSIMGIIGSYVMWTLPLVRGNINRSFRTHHIALALSFRNFLQMSKSLQFRLDRHNA